MKTFNISYHYAGRAFSEKYKAFGKVHALKQLIANYPLWGIFKNLEIIKIK